MNVEGLYKIPGVKSKIQYLKKLYNHREPVNISEFEPTVATSLLILFLRFVSMNFISFIIVFKIKRKNGHMYFISDSENCQNQCWRIAKRYHVSSRPHRLKMSHNEKHN